MKQLELPARELREYLLRDVDFKDRLMTGQLHQRAGVQTMDVYSLGDLFAVLDGPFPLVDVAEIARWCSDILHDPELGIALAAVAEGDGPELSRITKARDLVALRLLQCHEAGQSA